jgi:nucleoside phosphorylase
MPNKRNPHNSDVVILTALQLEHQIVLTHLSDIQEIVHPRGTVYQRGIFPRKTHALTIAVAETGKGGESAAVETERALAFFRPKMIFFVGIAAGLKDVKLSDVVASTKVYNYESGKAASCFSPRPEAWQASYSLEQRAKAEAHKPDWLNRLGDRPPIPPPRVFVGAIAAGEKVVASTQSGTYTFLRTTYEDALAVEMEGHGFLSAVRRDEAISALVIRGISDLIDQKAQAEASGSQEQAARHAAAFAFEVLAHVAIAQPARYCRDTQ